MPISFRCNQAVICYNDVSMNSVPLPLDISSNKDLVKLAKEVRKTNTPRALIQDDETLAILVPAEPGSSLKKRT